MKVWTAVLCFALPAWAAAPVKIGSKRFTESYILAEMAVALAKHAGDPAEHAQGLGGTAIAYRALEQGSVDLYPDYTGTIVEAILQSPTPLTLEEIRARLKEKGIGVTAPLGFNNTYALAVPSHLGVTKISQLRNHPELRLGFSHEFLGRKDGWPGVSLRYGLKPNAPPQALDHGLAYEAIRRGAIDVTDAYSTDAQLKRYQLRVLEDDLGFFPKYEPVFLYRLELQDRFPKTLAALEQLGGTINESTMVDLNSQAELNKMPFAQVARGFLAQQGKIATTNEPIARRGLLSGILESIVRHGPRHLLLVLISLGLAILVGIPLGILASRSAMLGHGVFTAAGLIQTLPSLALLCFFIPLLGTGVVPALAALFLYELLPIMRNTLAGLQGIPSPLLESAHALGLSRRALLTRVLLPLAAPTILAGIKTSAVIGVGTATLAAFIGAGGLGEPISIGLNLNDTEVILTGAIPAALLAWTVQWGFDLLERVVVPRGLRLGETDELETAL